MEKLEGVIDRVLFYNESNGYTVASIFINLEKRKIAVKKAKLAGSNMTVVGTMDRRPIEEEEYLFFGDFVDNKKFGLQFKFESFERKEINSSLGVITFLSSELFPGVGVRAARLIVDALGRNAIKKIKEDPHCLDSIKLSVDQRACIVAGIVNDQKSSEYAVFLIDHGVTMDMAHKIISALEGANVIEVVKANPYILIDKVERFGFKKADSLAERLGIRKDAPCRLKALLYFGLKEILYSKGDSYVEVGELFYSLEQYIHDSINKDVYDNVIKELVDEKKIYIDDKNRVFDFKNYIYEQDLASEISLFLKNIRNDGDKLPEYSDDDIKRCFDEIRKDSDVVLAKEQEEAILKAFTEPLVIITGGPGTGKTTIIYEIIQMYFKLNKDNNLLKESIALLAPTGRAAKRLSESTKLDAMTIHRYLGYTGDDHFEYGKYNKTNDRLIIVDEASMMDLPLASRLFSAASNKSRIIIVGDVDQLPSVGPGQVLKDLIDSNYIKTIRLTKIHRQAADSSIISLAHSVNESYLPENILDKLPDRNFIVTDRMNLPRMVTDLFVKAIEKGKTVKDIQVLVPMYRNSCGINALNNLIQEAINPCEKDNEIDNLGRKLRINDKVIQLVNRAEKKVMNGDIGYIQSFKYEKGKIKGVRVAFETIVVDYEMDELEDLTLAYVISIHKSQGSEFDVVIMPFTTEYYVMLKKKLIYTGITRAKKSLIMIGEPYSLKLGISRFESSRKTILRELLSNFMESSNIYDEINKIDEIDDSITEELFEIPSNDESNVDIGYKEEKSVELEEITEDDLFDALGAKEIDPFE